MQPSNIGSPTSCYGEFKIENMKKMVFGELDCQILKNKLLKNARFLYYVSVASQKYKRMIEIFNLIIHL
jgi:hypothetical protein